MFWALVLLRLPFHSYVHRNQCEMRVLFTSSCLHGTPDRHGKSKAHNVWARVNRKCESKNYKPSAEHPVQFAANHETGNTEMTIGECEHKAREKYSKTQRQDRKKYKDKNNGIEEQTPNQLKHRNAALSQVSSTLTRHELKMTKLGGLNATCCPCVEECATDVAQPPRCRFHSPKS